MSRSRSRDVLHWNSATTHHDRDVAISIFTRRHLETDAGYMQGPKFEGVTMAAILRVRAYFLVLVVLLTTISVACAADQTITLRLGAKTVLALERPFATVLIGDPNIVDVHTLSGGTVILEPLNLGANNIV